MGEGYLAQVAERLIDQGLRVRTILVADDVRFELLRCIGKERRNLVVVSGDGRSGRTELPLGSVTSFLLEHATAPILIVREGPDEREFSRRSAVIRIGGVSPHWPTREFTGARRGLPRSLYAAAHDLARVHALLSRSRRCSLPSVGCQ